MKARQLICGVLLGVLAAMTPAALHASTFLRASLKSLTAKSGTIVVGEVVDAESYWNRDANFILTDVHLRVFEVLKGQVGEDEIVVTIMGGTVGDLSVVIPGGASFEPGSSYAVFLGDGDLPGVKRAQTVRSHSQGVFNIVLENGELKAVSQAAGLSLVADSEGEIRAAGGGGGFPLDTLIRQVRSFATRSQEDHR